MQNSKHGDQLSQKIDLVLDRTKTAILPLKQLIRWSNDVFHKKTRETHEKHEKHCFWPFIELEIGGFLTLKKTWKTIRSPVRWSFGGYENSEKREKACFRGSKNVMTWGSKRGGPGGKNSKHGDQKGHKGLEKHLKTIRLVLLVRFRRVKTGQKFLKKSAFYVVWLTEIYIIGYWDLKDTRAANCYLHLSLSPLIPQIRHFQALSYDSINHLSLFMSQPQ